MSTSQSVLEQHGQDLSYHHDRPPDVVVFPESTAEVSAVVRLANERHVPVVPFGVGSSLEGHVIPLHGGISLDLTRMDRVLTVHAEDLTAVVQAGAMRCPPQPPRQPGRARLPRRSGRGRHARRHGRDQRKRHDDRALRRHARAMRGLEVVLADGTVIRGRARRQELRGL